MKIAQITCDFFIRTTTPHMCQVSALLGLNVPSFSVIAWLKCLVVIVGHGLKCVVGQAHITNCF